MNLTGKTAIVTGGAKGIGKAICEKLASLGANVVVCDVILPSAEETANELTKLGVKSLSIKTDVSNFEEVEAMVNTVKEKFQTIDILVNNAGVTRDKPLIRLTEEDWNFVMNINLKGTFNCTKAVARIMMSQKSGKIINISSVVGVMGNAMQSVYSSSKAGVIGFTKSIAKELASRNINVNAIAPGFIETDMTASLSQEVKDNYFKLIPLGRFGKPSEVADLVAFLASDEAKYITGQVIHLDGGMVM